ncbi:hypothetical protein M9H77_04848 [Catharanthus roseus]|uniref:Uncharacterized protein n=1 Tax=Catharanthus roseus TaxID=4058 RepID=A0ACC0CFD2_CATRO|nr:hypothetical protein M9H77_04848 [Catharanthus roseus]
MRDLTTTGKSERIKTYQCSIYIQIRNHAMQKWDPWTESGTITRSSGYKFPVLVKEMVGVAAPSGQIILTSWCHRNLLLSEQFLPLDGQKFIKKICDLILLHPLCSVNEYMNLFQSHHVEDMKTDDWCEFASPFWTAMVGYAWTIKGFFSLLCTSDDKRA